MNGSTRQFLRPAWSTGNEVQDLLQTIFVAELLAPSKCLWLVSAWIRNVTVIQGSTGAFRALDPSWGQREIRLADALESLLNRGTQVVMATKPLPDNLHVVDELRARLCHLGKFDAQTPEQLHAKGLLSDDYFVSGSMNLTYAGVERSTELVSLETDAATIASLHLDFHGEYGGTL